MSDDVIAEIAELASRWRYDHPGTAQFSHDQQMADGLELLKILERHDIPWPRDHAMKVIPAPANAASLDSLIYTQGDWPRDLYYGLDHDKSFGY